ncbi:MAG: proline--tRNA ligase [Candidatus Absconditabacterales bacterium]
MAKLTTRATDYSQWYNEIVQEAGLAESSVVRGCMVIKPYGFAIRENIKDILDKMFKNTGHVNAYFPILIPKSFFSKEAAHVEGFAKECAIVTHYRLKNDPNGKGVIVDPEAKLEEELIIRPTSETIIWNSYKNWIHSYRDLPLLINQRANVMRWEMRTRMFLRTSEFLRQEGHTAHASAEEADAEAKKMLDVYNDFATHFMAIDPVLGVKPEHEKFAGAVETYTFEPIMQDGKALQAGTSHYLGQNFAKAFDVKFTNTKNELEFVYATSRGVSTRLIGGLIMAHSDDQGLIVPPALAPIHVVIVPIFKTPEEYKLIQNYIQPLIDRFETTRLDFKSKYFHDTIPLRWKIDADTNKSPGRKFNEYELKGVPIRITVGARDIASGMVEIFKRELGEKSSVKIEDVDLHIDQYIYKAQNNLLKKNKEFRETHTFTVSTYDEFKEKIEQGFVMAHRDGTTETADKIKTETSATVRCIPFDAVEEAGVCIFSGKPSIRRVLFAKSY